MKSKRLRLLLATALVAPQLLALPASRVKPKTRTGVTIAPVVKPDSRRSVPPVVGWQSPAKLLGSLHYLKVFGKKQGELTIGAQRIEFKPRKGHTLRWTFSDIRTFFLSPHRLKIETYKSRKHYLPGERQYQFEVNRTVPPQVAAALAQGVRRPSQNADPGPDSSNVETIPAHHRRTKGGTNGMLRFGSGGIEYVTDAARDSRSWRWADIQTVSSLDPYHLVVFGYRDTYSFDLTQPMTRTLLNWITDEVYKHHPLDRGSARYAGEQGEPYGQ